MQAKDRYTGGARRDLAQQLVKVLNGVGELGGSTSKRDHQCDSPAGGARIAVMSASRACGVGVPDILQLRRPRLPTDTGTCWAASARTQRPCRSRVPSSDDSGVPDAASAPMMPGWRARKTRTKTRCA